VRRLAPTAEDTVDLRAAYSVPAGRHVRVNFAASVDGATAVDGKSRGLSSDADRELFQLLRALSDVVLVGAGTAREENYGGAKGDNDRVAPIAVVSRSLHIDPESRLFTDTRVRPIVITCADAPAERLVVLNEIADIIVAGDDAVDISRALDELAGRGLERVICEGGPHLFGWLAAAKAYDELCVSIAPLVTGGDAQRMIAGVESELVDPLRLVHVLEEDGHLFLRYSTA
jgi:riboflavin-specific deaminase-like protein